MNAERPSLPSGTKLPESLASFAPSAFKGDSPPRRDLVEGRLPRGKLVILAGEGDVGKTWLLLDLFCAINDGDRGYAFGGKVVKGGLPCLFLSGEDDRGTIDLRLKTIRGGGKVQPAEHGAIVPAPDIGVMHLVGKDIAFNTVRATVVLDWLDAQLQAQRDAFGELGFLVIDTFSTFLPINANAPEEVQGAYAALTVLASKHDLCVIVTHHVAKGSDHSKRAAIRGSTAVVDGARAAYVLHRLDEDKAKQVKEAHSLEGEVIRLQIVKNNLGLDRTPITFLRHSTGALSDISGLVATSQLSPEHALARVVKEAFDANRALTKTGNRGVHECKDEAWPGGIGKLGRDKLRGLVDKAVAKGLIENLDGLLVPGRS